MVLRRFGIALLFVLLYVSPVRADSAMVADISKQLVCQCGCNMVLLNCSHAECSSRESMTALIVQQIEQGQSEEQIIQLFVTQYGEQVLTEPPKRGFNLMAWITPFAAILAGGGVIYVALKKWVRRGGQIKIAVDDEEGDEEYRYRLDQELAEFSDRSFR